MITEFILGHIVTTGTDVIVESTLTSDYIIARMTLYTIVGF
jgi:hypothetical protein